MDCCICSPMATKYRLPRNAICAPCYEGAKAIITFLNNDEQEEEEDGHGSVRSRGLMKPNSTTKGMRDAWEGVKEMRDREEETTHRAAYLQQGLALAWEEGIHTDILVEPGTGAPIPAHKAILAVRSEVFRHMLSSDEHCKAPAGDSISLPELAHEELSLFLAFLYTGALGQDLPERQLHALLVAGDKYDVPFLRRACEARLTARVGPRNVLRTLEVAELSSSAALRERAMGAVVEHAEQVVFSPEYDDFAVRNAGLCVEITRALLAKMSMRTEAQCEELIGS
ncbi:BTB/POZ domain-containing protein At1g01640 [Phragmites australis]|uniref:BTB/POZ domain-containing protein At1g01640 n=1 Tax=Phragmites australis TaxID=29695 RepID=UPI002D78A829|nr:BTB/POZ domain-containing protein At1g01640 [Phragmites australis]